MFALRDEHCQNKARDRDGTHEHLQQEQRFIRVGQGERAETGDRSGYGDGGEDKRGQGGAVVREAKRRP